KFTMCCAVIKNFPRARVKYTFIDRNDYCYPKGFDTALREQIQHLENLIITDEEIAFMKRQCNYIPDWFYIYLKGFRYQKEWVTVKQDEKGHLRVDIEGNWNETIMLEVKLLAIISELNYIITGQLNNLDMDDYYNRTYNKARRMFEAGCYVSEFGTRRRASFIAQETAVRAMTSCNNHNNFKGKFTGTSNVYLAMKYDLKPIGTMAHEFVCGIAGMYGPVMANHIAMQYWSSTYRGALGTFLYDTYGWEIFSLNFSEDYANMFKGLRVDSGDNYEQVDNIIEKYRQLGIDPTTKQVIFSNALNVDEALRLQKYCVGRCLPSYGIGTHLTNDFPGVKPLNIVIKLLAIKITESWPEYSDTCKLSEDKGKYTGQRSTVDIFRKLLHLPPLPPETPTHS
ncbi:MAG: nicotinate phosphoribosyltransferase, partial [Muribaculaceae bacterium]|nr:nicotinate phosphoribosyltransferase [Muribaculaceae bacterium]